MVIANSIFNYHNHRPANAVELAGPRGQEAEGESPGNTVLPAFAIAPRHSMRTLPGLRRGQAALVGAGGSDFERGIK